MHLKELPIDWRETTVKPSYPRSVLLKKFLRRLLNYIFLTFSIVRRPLKRAIPTLTMRIPLRRLAKKGFQSNLSLHVAFKEALQKKTPVRRLFKTALKRPYGYLFP